MGLVMIVVFGLFAWLLASVVVAETAPTVPPRVDRFWTRLEERKGWTRDHDHDAYMVFRGAIFVYFLWPLIVWDRLRGVK